MEPDLLARIVEKASAECQVEGISLFNWTEPLLHPKLPELIHIVQRAGIDCHLSSNLNLLPDADAIMAANPASFKISASGFTQELYGHTHYGGDIERVKRHMKELAQAKKRNGATTRIFVSFHRYRGNLKEEPALKQFAAGLGFEFEPTWALMFPLEKILAYAEGSNDVPLSADDLELVDRLALPLKETLAAAGKHTGRPCRLRETQISMDFRGKVQLCCGLFDSGRFTVGDYLDLTLEQIQQLRRSHGMCERCMQHGAHLFLTYQVPEMEQMILERVAGEDAELLDLRREMARMRRQRCMQRLLGGRQMTALRNLYSRLFHPAARAAGEKR